MAAVPPQIFAIDLGTSGMKAALVAADGTVTGWAERPVPLRVLPGGGAEQDPHAWWAALGEVAADLGRAHPEQLRAVTAVCASTQGEGTIAVDAAGEPLTPCISWLDMRGAPHLRRQFGGFPAYQGMSVRRIARWLRLTGGMPSPTGKDPAAHMLFVRDTMPQVYARTATFLNVLDWINLKLTGRTVATVDSILTSWVTDNRRPGDIRYSPALVADCGIGPDKLPPIVACTEVIGTLTPDAATHLGLPEMVQVVAGAIDNTAAAIGAGTTGDNDPHLYVGTSSWIAAHVPRKKTDVAAGIASVPCAIGDRYLMTALQATAGANLTWLRDKVVEYDDPLLSAGHVSRDEGTIFDAFDTIIPTVPPGANGVLYTPWLYGERAPVDDSNLRAGFLNISLDTNRSDLLRAVFEGVAFNTRWLAGAVDRFLGAPVTSLAITGGGALSDSWCQIFADVLGVQIRRDAQPLAVNVRGAGWIGAVGTGLLSFADIPDLMRTDRIFTPNPAHRATYDEIFDVYRALHRRLAPVYRRLNRPPSGS
ncbi:xylulokinase [Micromonospora endophytica]|uniref:Xylulose kinase n=1 Tax=Micromonospora endophytica TaxID=515350 RepID=A0A2W2D0E5_9ACTN|nr:FGGY-family carbohydrate kinase [Micromonospora endophytica]PZF97238.1 xylulose kinase [Micromonospora endophytica]RIW51422.1 xylulose kinase [Micromonospora endophytica]